MKRLVVLVALLVAGAGAYVYLKGTVVSPGDKAADMEKSMPKRMLDNTRSKAKAIEEDAQRRADEAMKKSE